MAFALLAAAAAAVAAAIADGYGSRIARSYGALRPVVVVREPLPAGRAIGPEGIESGLEVRRVPVRFVPPGTLTRPAQALGLAPRAELAPGSYLAAAELRPPSTAGPAVPGLRKGQRPVQISVTGAGALLAEGNRGTRPRVDVVVTSEPSAGGRGRTYVAASDVPLLGIDSAATRSAPGATVAATLGLTRGQALELIAAESFARQVALLPRAAR